MGADAAASLWFDQVTLTSLGAGHIHDTYLLEDCSVEPAGQFVLQEFNEVVFTDAALVMNQTLRLLDQWRKQHDYLVPALQLSKGGNSWERVDGQLWRVWRYIADTTSIGPVESLSQARAAGAAFGALQSNLADLPAPVLTETIEGFLQLRFYLAAYDKVAAAAPLELDRIVQDNRGLADQLGKRNAHIHGDCKVDNLLFDARAQSVVAIIDFDTAMYGHWAWDFGDLVRSVCFSRGAADVDHFAACLEGFAPHQPLAQPQHAVAAPGYVALMLGVRFLTDHLSGDVYFRVETHGENLLRAREQFDLFQNLQALRPQLLDAAQDILGSA